MVEHVDVALMVGDLLHPRQGYEPLRTIRMGVRARAHGSVDTLSYIPQAKKSMSVSDSAEFGFGDKRKVSTIEAACSWSPQMTYEC